MYDTKLKDYQNILITGSSGFVGKALAQKFCTEGFEVLGFSRSNPHIPGIKNISGDILDKIALANAAKDVDIIIHCAAITPHFGRAKGMSQINIEGTRNVVKAANKNKIKRLVFISSEAAYAHPFKDVITENDPIGGIDNYGRSKAEGEKIINSELHDEIESVIIRPAQIYGLGDQSPFTNRVILMLKKDRIITPAFRDSGISLIHIKDVVNGIYTASLSEKTSNKIYNVSSDDKISLEQISLELDPIRQKRNKILKLPVFLIRFLLSLRWLTYSIRFKEVRPIFKLYNKKELTGSLLLGGPYFSNKKMKEELGFEPEITVIDGFKDLLI
ncbi:NAD(P)-dependent oxidoreductase [Hyphobacterium sp. CCMP332]|nr:NAD(P)-dependent oxidoreductase [Hyphobacterium sp. CCMP332]